MSELQIKEISTPAGFDLVLDPASGKVDVDGIVEANSFIGDGSALSGISAGALLKTHHWYDNVHRSFGQGGIYVLSNTFSQVGINSKFLISASIVVGATDNVSGHLQAYYNGVWHSMDEFRGSSSGQADYNRGSWGDLAHRHESGMPLKQTATFVWEPNVTGTIGLRMYIQAENGTRYINRRNSWNSAVNDISSISTLTVQEVAV